MSPHANAFDATSSFDAHEPDLLHSLRALPPQIEDIGDSSEVSVIQTPHDWPTGADILSDILSSAPRTRHSIPTVTSVVLSRCTM
jgi:hypothetical protein